MSVKRKKKGLGGEAMEDGDDSASPADAYEPVAASAGEAGEGAEGPSGAPEGNVARFAAGREGDSSDDGRGGEVSDQERGAHALEATVALLEGQLAEARDQLLRKAADFDNYRKRMARDKEESVRYANTALIVDLIDAMDGLERAISSTESSQDFASLHQGVVLIEKQLMDSLERKWGLHRMTCTGKPFDPSYHQAVMMGEPGQGEEQIVLEEYQSGYLLHERVVRPAKVKISAPRAIRSATSASVDAAGAVRASDGGDGEGSDGQGR
jgi:molecular chaperone GrpE